MSDIIKTAIEYPPKLASDKVSYVNFFKSAQITKKQKKKIIWGMLCFYLT